ncbi:MFS transporter [Ensifer adhaerens]|uniref:MFS transporter n=1 Tax=Ensifer adhaerens TaxID=106592 RepID=UPI001CC1341C|nr:MFS transporter [Ensifer adhaerens]MBZ7927728.1 MFS transporter [Ensifer adhaerens]UAX96629.1 MFS transporter [Ensifer adhaerens]UAY04027.1 MFS transporter [Ensifer adhaerens]UAY12013.1 MFS transporter [Ensifer adhaerens]
MLVNEGGGTTTSPEATGTTRAGVTYGSIIMYALLLISYVLNSMDRQLFSVLAVDVRGALDLSLQEVGFAATVFTLGMGIAGLPTAYLLSKLPRKTVSLMGLGIFSAATLLTAYSHNLPSLLLYRFLSGVGEAMQFTAILAIGTTYFYRNRGFATGAVNFSFGIGALVGPNVGASILGSHGWQMPFVSYGLMGLPLGLLIILGVRGWFTEADVARELLPRGHDKASERGWTSSTVILAIASMLGGLVIYGYLGLYPTFLRDALGFEPAEAAFAIGCYGLGALTSIVGGWIGDRFDHRKLLLVSFIISGVSGSLLFTSLGHSLALHATFSFVFGSAVSGMVFVNLAAGIIKSVHPERASLGAGILVASLYVPASFAGYLLATLRNATGWATAALLQLGLLAIIAGILAVLTRRRPFSLSN